MSRDRYKVIDTNPHFITCSIVSWLPLLSDPDAARIILDSLEFLQDEDRVILHGYVVMKDHLHMLASANQLAKHVANFKSFTAKQIILLLKRKNRTGLLRMLEELKAPHKTDRQYQVWQEGSHPERIYNEKMIFQKLRYMHANPLRKEYVENPWDWPYSSYNDYYEGKGAIRLNGVRTW